MSRDPDFFKIITGQDLDSFTRLPDPEESFNYIIKNESSAYPLRLLGTGEKDVYVSEEERYLNFHIMGAPGEGKSRFLEYNIRKDIDMGNGLCLLDPSDSGDTVNHVLSYCESIGHKKVILIDPRTVTRDRIPIINPLNPKHSKSSVEGVMESLSILFGTSATDTPRIQRYLPALLRILTKTNLTIAETIHFANFWTGQGYREAIFDKIYGSPSDVHTLRDVLKNEPTFQNYFSSTINRLNTLWQEPLSLILGSRNGVDFHDAVSKGWVILVNLSPYMLSSTDARFLGILIISQIIQAVDTLSNNGWKGIYYLYMDEAGRFSTPQIDDVLTQKRKSGLRLVLAHHGFDQFENKRLMNAILNGARIKLMFDTPNYDDRVQMCKALSYGGDISPVAAAFANQNIPKRYAVVRKGKETPVRIRIPEVSDTVPVSDEYLNSILSQPFYKTRQQIKDEANARVTPTYPKADKPRAASNRPPARTNPVPKRTVSKDVPKDGEQPPDAPPFEPFKV